MFGKTTLLKSLETRKKLLLAESDVNRIELGKDLALMKGEVERIKRHVRTLGSVASSAALLATTFSIFRRRFGLPHKMPESNGKSWISAALDGARLGASVFLKIKSFLHNRE